ncbi:TPA: hypothetical protein ACPVGF_004380, partial [Escherichia coli]
MKNVLILGAGGQIARHVINQLADKQTIKQRISTRHRRPARWADSHTAPAPGKVGGFPHG